MIKNSQKTPATFDNPLLASLLDVENPREHLQKLCLDIAQIDRKFEPQKSVVDTAERFFALMERNLFWPSPLVLINGSESPAILAGNTALSLSDSYDHIFETLKRTSSLLQHEVQVALDFSDLRAARSHIQSSPLQSVGPVKFMQLFQNAPQALDQVTLMRFQLSIDHLDILPYLDYILKAPAHIRFAIGLTAEFLDALKTGGKIGLRHKPNAEASLEIPASELFKAIAKIVWKGLPIDFIYLDRLQQFKAASGIPDACLLNMQNQLTFENELLMTGVLNLEALIGDAGVDADRLGRTLQDSVHFLDNCFEKHTYCDEETKLATKQYRRIGLSVVGLDGFLSRVNPDRDPAKDQKHLGRVLDLLQHGLITASRKLGDKRGAQNSISYKGLEYPTRHAQLLAQIHQPLLSHLAGTPAYLLKREMTLKDFLDMYDLHAQWQNGLGNVASLKHPAKSLDMEKFSHILLRLHTLGLVTFELTN